MRRLRVESHLGRVRIPHNDPAMSTMNMPAMWNGQRRASPRDGVRAIPDAFFGARRRTQHESLRLTGDQRLGGQPSAAALPAGVVPPARIILSRIGAGA